MKVVSMYYKNETAWLAANYYSSNCNSDAWIWMLSKHL